MKNIVNKIKHILKFLIENSKPKKIPILIKTNGRIISNGKESYHNGNLVVKGNGNLEVGSYCAIGQDVKIILSNHDMNNVCMQYTFYRKNFGINLSSKYQASKVIIENDVWIGDNVIVLPNVRIATGAVIAAGAIVTKNVEPYAIVGGNPAKIIKKRFTEERIQELLDSKWWEWNTEKIKNNKTFFIKD